MHTCELLPLGAGEEVAVEGLCPHGDFSPFPLRKPHFESSASDEVPVAYSGDWSKFKEMGNKDL